MMRRNVVSFIVISVFALMLAGCATVSRASVQQGDIITTAEVERLPQHGVFRTKVVIVHIDATGTERVMSAPTVISREGETATISVENETEHITVLVSIPTKANYDNGAKIDITIEQNGKLVSSPKMIVQVPN